MKRKILIIIFALTILFTLSGCQERTENGNAASYVHDDVTLVRVASKDGFSIYVHEQTRVMYIRGTDMSGGFTVMLDADGKPLIWEGEL